MRSQPLASVLRAEGVSPQLRSVVLYGAAMADWAQEAAEQQAQAGPGAVPGAGQQQQQQHPPCPAWPPLTTAQRTREGCASLALFTRSLGRFGAPGAFMTPSYGAGSLPEALVRHAAVHGAVTALRQALAGLVVGPAGAALHGAAGGVSEQQGDGARGPGLAGAGGEACGAASAAGSGAAVRGCVCSSGQVLECKEALVAGPGVLR